MKKERIEINIVKHVPTGAEIPIIITKMGANNVIEEYREWTEKRKGFKLKMLQNRWDKCREDVIDLLQKYQVPGHLNHREMDPTKLPVDVAIFFEEYIYALEKKEKLAHNKLKARYFVTGSMDN